MRQHACVISWIALIACSSAWAQSTTRVSVTSGGAQAHAGSIRAAISSDGRYVAFHSVANDLVPGDTNGVNDVFVHDRESGITERVNVHTSGAQANGESFSASISPDGRYVAFASYATNLVTPSTIGVPQIYVRDRLDGSTTIVSVNADGAEGIGFSYWPSISADGRYVAFQSTATNLVPGSTSFGQVYVHDRVAGTNERVSVDWNGAFGYGHGDSNHASISADGRYVAFGSSADDLVPGDTNDRPDIFLRDRQSGTTERVNLDALGGEGNDGSFNASISSDGRYVAFDTFATNLAFGGAGGFGNVIVHDTVTGANRCANVGSAGAMGDGNCFYPSISANGRFVAFSGNPTNLIPGDTNGCADCYVHDFLTDATTRVSVDSDGAQANLYSQHPSISADGRCVAFESTASNLVAGDTNGGLDIFVRDQGASASFAPLCFGDGTEVLCPCSNAGSPGHGCENSAATGGALLVGAGDARLTADTVELTTSGELPASLSIVLQGSAVISAVPFGGGLRCAGGTVIRLFYVAHATSGMISVPQAADPSVTMRSAQLGDPIPLGGTRIYQVYYRDPSVVFCPSGFNATNAIAIAWGA